MSLSVTRSRPSGKPGAGRLPRLPGLSLSESPASRPCHFLRRWIVLTVWLALVLAGGANAGAHDSSADNNYAARQIYLGKFAKWQKLYDPARYSKKQWQVWMEKMSRKARLQPDQTGLVARYIEES